MNDLSEIIDRQKKEIVDFIDGVRKAIYEQGRADKYKEITSAYMLLTEKQVEEIRAEAIDEFKQNVMDYIESNGTIPNHFNVEKIAEQLKEHNCEGKTIDFDKISKRVLINKIFEIKEECRPAFLDAVIDAIQNCPPYDCEGLEEQE